MTLIIASAHGAVPENLDGADLLEIRVDGIETNEAKHGAGLCRTAGKLPMSSPCHFHEGVLSTCANLALA